MATSDPADNGSDQPRDQPEQQPEEGRTAHPSGVPAADLGRGFAIGPTAPWDPPGRAELWGPPGRAQPWNPPASSTGPPLRPDGVRDAFPDGDERWADPEDSEFWASAVDPTPPSAPPPIGRGRSWLDDPIGDLAPALPSLGTPPPPGTDPEEVPPPWSTPQTPATVPPAVADVPPPAYPQPPPTGWQRPPALAGPSAGPSADAFSQSADPPPGSPPPPPPGGPHPPMPPGGPIPPYPPNPPLPPPKRNNRLALILGLIALLLLCCCGSVAGSMLIWGDDLYEQIRDRSRQSIVHRDGATD